MKIPEPDFLSSAPANETEERLDAGYPNECLDFTSFSGSLAALVTDGEWLNNPFTQKRGAIVVDFASDTQEEADASLAHGWNGAWEFPIGSVNTVRSRTETNEQNARIERHLALIVTGETMRDFFWKVTEQLLDSHSCTDPDCRACNARFTRDLAFMFAQMATLGFETIHLFSKWQPSASLRNILQAEDVQLQWNPLSAIPSTDLEANRYYSIWDGSPSQYDDFMARFWSPTWTQQMNTEPGAGTPAKKRRPGRLTVQLPEPDPEWRSLTGLHLFGFYAMRDTDFSERQIAEFVQEANRNCLQLLRKARDVTTDPSDFTWQMRPEEMATIAAAQNIDPEETSWAISIGASIDPDDAILRSFFRAWAPRLHAILRFAMPVEPQPECHIFEGSAEVLTFEHDP